MQNQFGTKRKVSRKLHLLLFLVVMMSGLFGCSKREEYVTVVEEAGKADEIRETDEIGKTDEAGKAEDMAVENETIYVDICGAIKHPGVYPMEMGARVFEVVELAGGLTEDAGRAAINQAECLTDGQKIYVPTQEEWEAGLFKGGEGAYISDAEKSDSRININTADVTALCSLPGIGETRAKAIIQYREEQGSFATVEDIQKVSGIKSGTYEKMKEFITVQ